MTSSEVLGLVFTVNGNLGLATLGSIRTTRVESTSLRRISR